MKKIAFIIFFYFCFASIFAQKQDLFLKIGAVGQADFSDKLIEPQPPVLPEKYLNINMNKASVFKPEKEMSTSKEIYDEVEKLRKYYAPFLKNYAPKKQEVRKRLYLKTFKWRKETEQDLKNFGNTLKGEGNWTEVSIPHYEPPLGKKVTYYYKELDIPENMFKEGTLYICFKGVDYIAHVFINDAYLGSHTGFFAPFEFNISDYARKGKNTILIKVENDYGSASSPDEEGTERYIGDKIFAATSPGYDDPVIGWHETQAGMGIYQDCYIESRSKLFIDDIFVRPLPGKKKAELWIDIQNIKNKKDFAKLRFSLYGKNFDQTLWENVEYNPINFHGNESTANPDTLFLGHGLNDYRLSIDIPDIKKWQQEKPYLYQLQAELIDHSGKVIDRYNRDFGIRDFSLDTNCTPKGMFYLNGKKIKLRGVNSMGYEQQDVMRRDTNQLITDILLAKVCNINFIRLTQRVVQPEVYEYCSMMGMMTQSDLPLFGGMRPHLFVECIRQSEEMEKLVRNYPCNIVVTFINERTRDLYGSPQRMMDSHEDFERFFESASHAVLRMNPERVIKPNDGDYDPPEPGLPDNHCYTYWYNGHGIDAGKLHKGFWQQVKPEWNYACGEFGMEALDNIEVMKKYYPKEWLKTESDGKWNPSVISLSQSARQHKMFYNTPNTMQEWIKASQEHQSYAIKLMTEAFRRDNRMVSFAYHLFIDAWPSGWMKTIMDCDRQPKLAFYTYREALKPLMVSIRTDRTRFFSNDTVRLELWICNDIDSAFNNYTLKYQLLKDNNVLWSNQAPADIQNASAKFQGFAKFIVTPVNKSVTFRLQVQLLDNTGKEIDNNEQALVFFPIEKPIDGIKICVLGSDKSMNIARSITKNFITNNIKIANTLIIENYKYYQQNEAAINEMISNGGKAVILDMEPGKYLIANQTITITQSSMSPLYFVSPRTNHSFMKDVADFDYRFWYDPVKDRPVPVIYNVITVDDKSPLIPVVSSTNVGWGKDPETSLAIGELKIGKGSLYISQIDFNNKIKSNPPAFNLFKKMCDKR